MKTILICLCICVSAYSIHAEAVRKNVNPPRAFARGIANMMTCWLEMPRGIIYENARIPVVGFISGTVKGAVLTTGRLGSGALDVVAMGLTRDGLHSSIFPEFVWDANWIPACGEDMVQESENVTVSPCEKLEECPPPPVSMTTAETPYYISMGEEVILQQPESDTVSCVITEPTTFSTYDEEEDMAARMDQLERDVQRIEELARILGRR